MSRRDRHRTVPSCQWLHRCTRAATICRSGVFSRAGKGSAAARAQSNGGLNRLLEAASSAPARRNGARERVPPRRWNAQKSAPAGAAEGSDPPAAKPARVSPAGVPEAERGPQRAQSPERSATLRARKIWLSQEKGPRGSARRGVAAPGRRRPARGQERGAVGPATGGRAPGPAAARPAYFSASGLPRGEAVPGERRRASPALASIATRAIKKTNKTIFRIRFSRKS